MMKLIVFELLIRANISIVENFYRFAEFIYDLTLPREYKNLHR